MSNVDCNFLLEKRLLEWKYLSPLLINTSSTSKMRTFTGLYVCPLWCPPIFCTYCNYLIWKYSVSGTYSNRYSNDWTFLKYDVVLVTTISSKKCVRCVEFNTDNNQLWFSFWTLLIGYLLRYVSIKSFSSLK